MKWIFYFLINYKNYFNIDKYLIIKINNFQRFFFWNLGGKKKIYNQFILMIFKVKWKIYFLLIIHKILNKKIYGFLMIKMFQWF